jgi:nicotinamide-nucleotide amidase
MGISDFSQRIEQVAARLGRALRAQRLLLSTAESCTAGGVAYAVTLAPGSSEWFERGFITYSNEAKIQVLGVAPAYLRDFGAVSEPVARAMALGALSHSSAQVAVAVTGVAGPGGGTEAKPVGMVCFAWAIRRDAQQAPWVKTATQRFDGDRSAVRSAAIVAALETLSGLLDQRQDV